MGPWPISEFTARGSIDHVIDVGDGAVDSDRAGLQRSTLWYADGDVFVPAEG